MSARPAAEVLRLAPATRTAARHRGWWPAPARGPVRALPSVLPPDGAGRPARGTHPGGDGLTILPVPVTSWPSAGSGVAVVPAGAARNQPGRLLLAADVAVPVPAVADLLRVLLPTDGAAPRASALSCGVGADGLLLDVEAGLRRVARAHRITGAPVLVRTLPGLTTGLDAAHVLEDEGVDPQRVLLTGCGAVDGDPAHLLQLAGWGYRLGVECSARSGDHGLHVAAELCRRGRSDAVALLRGAGPAGGDDVAAALSARGVAGAQLADALSGTLRRWLDGEDPGAAA